MNKTTNTMTDDMERRLPLSGRMVLNHLKSTKMDPKEALSIAMEAQRLVDKAIQQAVQQAQKSPANKLPVLEKMKYMDRVVNQARTKVLSAFLPVETTPYED